MNGKNGNRFKRKVFAKNLFASDFAIKSERTKKRKNPSKDTIAHFKVCSPHSPYGGPKIDLKVFIMRPTKEELNDQLLPMTPSSLLIDRFPSIKLTNEIPLG